MADVVIVVGARRGHETVPVAEIRQMVGRAGRRHGGVACEALVLVDSEDLEDVERGMKGDARYEVSSSMASCDDIVFHLTAEICSGEVADEADAARWYARSFGEAQGRRPDLKVAFRRLVECGALVEMELGYVPTEVARIAAELYFHPANVKAWRDNFSEVFEMGLEKSDAAAAWALGSVPVSDALGDFGKHRFVMSLYKDALPVELSAASGTVARGTLWWSALGGHPVGRMRNLVLDMRRDFGRVARALERLDKAEEWGMGEFFRSLAERVRRGVPERLGELCAIEGMTKGLAEFLYNEGVMDREAIKESVDWLESELDEGTAKFLREVADGVR